MSEDEICDIAWTTAGKWIETILRGESEEIAEPRPLTPKERRQVCEKLSLLAKQFQSRTNTQKAKQQCNTD